MSRHTYSDCSYCGGQVKEAKVKVDFMRAENFYLFENVPAGVCQQCGEKYFTASVAKRMDASIRRNRWKRFAKIPIMSFPQMSSS